MFYLIQDNVSFVLDTCLWNDECKIVEINCINCSGFYHMDVNKVIEALETKFSYEHKKSETGGICTDSP